MTKPVRSSSFRALDFPALGRPVEPAAPRRAAIPECETATQIIVVDDDPEMREQLSDILQEPLFCARITSSATAFFKELETFNAQIALMDLSLPGRDGVDILKHLRDVGFAGEVVIMSGTGRHVLETARRIADEYGLTISGLLPKPFTAEQLLSLVDRSGAQGNADDARIRAAIVAQQIRPYFQPKVDLKTGKVTGAEALSRWHHPERGILTPAGYMKAVRSAGSQAVHDYRILECTLALCAKINAAGRKLKFSVNFAADDVLGDYFLDVIKDAQTRHNVAPEQLIIELTETEAVEKLDALAERLLKLRLYGTEISIDDFGTGHSSLSRIQRLPVSEIKIDRSFVSGLTEYSDDHAIVRSIIELSHSFGCVVVAEGVETLESLSALDRLGCDMMQGFIFSPAVNEQTFSALIDSEFPALTAMRAALKAEPPQES